MKNGPYILVAALETYPGKKYRGKYCYEHHMVWWKKHKQITKENTKPNHTKTKGSLHIA